MPTISVIVPVYKVEPYLHQCVDSILGQRYRDFELILVDDGSPDGCPAICDEYARLDSRVRVIHKENGGLSSARNAGLDAATGKYVAFVDSDDWIDPDMLQIMMESIRSSEADMVLCGVSNYYDSQYHGDRNENDCCIYDRIIEQEDIPALLESQAWYYVIAWNKLYNCALFSDIRFPEGFIHEDAAVAHRIWGKCHRVGIVGKKLYHYRQRDNSIMGQAVSISRTDILSALADRIAYCYQSEWDKLFEITIIRYIDCFFEYYTRFRRTAETERYFCRMDASLRTALPYILKAKSLSLGYKIYLSVIRIKPGIYSALKRLLRG